MFLDNISPWNEYNVRPSYGSAILFKQLKQVNLVHGFPWSTAQYDSLAAGYG